MKTKDEVLIKLGKQAKKVNVEFNLIANVEKMSEAVDSLLVQYNKITDELRQKGSVLKSEYERTIKASKELGIDAEPLMKEAGKAIGKLKMIKLI